MISAFLIGYAPMPIEGEVDDRYSNLSVSDLLIGNFHYGGNFVSRGKFEVVGILQSKEGVRFMLKVVSAHDISRYN